MTRRAIISVYRKEGIVELARGLSARGFEIVSTGGTAQELAKEGVKVTGISDVTGFPEILDGRVKTLHPKVHAGILAKRGVAAHDQALREQGVTPVDVVVVNLYPFEDRVAKGVPFSEALEYVDIGGPTLLRAAAKNFAHVAVVVDPADYTLLLEQLDRDAGPDAATRLYLAQKAFRHTSRYEAAIAGYFAQVEPRAFLRSGRDGRGFPYRLPSPSKVQDLRYGENPHQRARSTATSAPTLYSIASARKLQGKALVQQHPRPGWPGAWHGAARPRLRHRKHTGPCGTAIGPTRRRRTRAPGCDPMSPSADPRLQPPRGRDRATPGREVRGGGDRAPPKRTPRRSPRRRTCASSAWTPPSTR